MYITIALIAFLLAVAYFVARRFCLQRVEYRRYFSEEGVFEGETVLLVEEIVNRSFLPLTMVDVDTFLSNDLQLEDSTAAATSGMQHFTSRFNLAPFMQVRRSITLICKKRGYYQPETVNINGLLRDAAAILYVYPKALPYEQSSALESEMQNTSHVNRRLLQDPFSFAGIRDYRYGDAFRCINYKATAKTGALKVNNQDYFSSRNIMIYIDFGQTSPLPLSTKAYSALMERALRYSADMVWHSIQQGYSVGFAANCNAQKRANHIRFPMGRGHSHYIEILKEMAVIRMSESCSFSWLLRQDIDILWNIDIYIMTANLSQDLDVFADIHASRGSNVTILALEVEDDTDDLA